MYEYRVKFRFEPSGRVTIVYITASCVSHVREILKAQYGPNITFLSATRVG